MSGIEQGGMGERFPHASGVNVTHKRDAIGGWPPVEAKRVRFSVSGTRNKNRSALRPVFFYADERKTNKGMGERFHCASAGST